MTTEMLGQNLQVLTQILDVQQQMMDHKQDWLQPGLTAFKRPKMTGDDDPETYIEAFEHHAIMTGLDKGYWASQLGALVVGKAQAAYRALPRYEARDYDIVKVAILYQLEINPEHYRHLFWAKKGAEEKQPWLLLQLLRDLFSKWVNLVSCDCNALADQIVLEQFLNDLEEWTQQWKDASETTVGVVLKQKDARVERSVPYTSRKSLPVETRGSFKCVLLMLAKEIKWVVGSV
ncbi:hypothetical protein Y1Q_0003039 [Alligator mississippiensis]|uniref:Uncharacterized protein n=1 Tax=Alligator mississippiensis TaxID=8496 RepID=A0A151MD74_ALLMI|nr:hypothetical protein Y1Q_0003039 [Alligator mississippiensis]